MAQITYEYNGGLANGGCTLYIDDSEIHDIDYLNCVIEKETEEYYRFKALNETALAEEQKLTIAAYKAAKEYYNQPTIVNASDYVYKINCTINSSDNTKLDYQTIMCEGDYGASGTINNTADAISTFETKINNWINTVIFPSYCNEKNLNASGTPTIQFNYPEKTTETATPTASNEDDEDYEVVDDNKMEKSTITVKTTKDGSRIVNSNIKTYKDKNGKYCVNLNGQIHRFNTADELNNFIQSELEKAQNGSSDNSDSSNNSNNSNNSNSSNSSNNSNSSSNKSNDDGENPTDPKVIIDPQKSQSIVVKTYNTTGEDASGSEKYQDAAAINIDAITVPVIQVNNRVIDYQYIDGMCIDYMDFLPSISLTIKDETKNIQYSDVPSMNNKITVIMTCPVDGVAKKISLDFYITNCEFNDGYVDYEGIYKFQPLEKVLFTQIGNKALTTYELLRLIAVQSGLGFAATKKCKDISDKRYRLVHSIKLKDYIQQQIELSGLDDDNIFDAWIDLFGYIVLVNVKYVMATQIESTDLTTYAIHGERGTSNQGVKQEVKKVPRVLTNDERSPKNNLQFTHYDSVVYTDDIINNGALNNYYIFGGPSSGNSINIKQIQTIDDSIDGIQGSNEYEFENIEFLGVEMSDTPILYQKQINAKYLSKIRTNQLEIMLTETNFALERGTLVSVLIYDYDPEHKKQIKMNQENVTATSNELNNADDLSVITPQNKGNEEEVTSQTAGVLNNALSDLYYIDSMKFIYDSEDQKIHQYLYLIKRGAHNNLLNKYTLPKINLDIK